MRRFLLVALVAIAALTVPTAASASTNTGGDGWVRVPAGPFDRPAGVLCDFPIHVEPIVDEVVMKVLETYPDGTSKAEAYKGALIDRVTNTATGASTDVDASGSAIIAYQPGGTFAMNSTWYVIGPVLVGFRDGTGNLPRGLYRINGVYTIAFSDTGFKTVNMLIGSEHNVCTDIG
jgi:hypothetical protein